MIKQVEQNNNHCEALKRSGQSKISIHRKLIRFVGLIFLVCFAFSSVGEAKHPMTPRHGGATNKTIERPAIRKKPDATVVRKHPQRTSESRRRPQASRARGRPQASRTRGRPQASRARGGRAQVSRARSQISRGSARGRVPVSRVSTRGRPQRVVPQTRQGRATAVRTRVQPNRRSIAQNRRSLPLNRRRGVATYLSKLPPHTQRNARLGGFDHLYAKGYYGTGTAAVIEHSGTWDEMHNIIGSGYGNLSPEIRENYKRNFLTPIGGQLHPDTKCSTNFPNHGSQVADVILKFSPDAKVQPVSTFYHPSSTQHYEVAAAILTLCSPQWNHVSIINISAGHKDLSFKNKVEKNADGTLKYLYKTVYAPKLVDAFKVAAAAGKVVVLAAGNNGENIQPHEYRTEMDITPRYPGYILKKLKDDPVTRQSIIIAGALDPHTNTLSAYSNRPGHWAAAQDSFLCTSGEDEFYNGLIGSGTSFAAPRITAGLLDLLSIPGVTPQRAARALMGSADPGLDPAYYGKGRMNLKRAEEQLQMGWY